MGLCTPCTYFHACTALSQPYKRRILYQYPFLTFLSCIGLISLLVKTFNTIILNSSSTSNSTEGWFD